MVTYKSDTYFETSVFFLLQKESIYKTIFLNYM